MKHGPLGSEITLTDVERLRKRVQVGDLLDAFVWTATDLTSKVEAYERRRTAEILKKYEHGAMTSEGFFSWNDLTIWNRALIGK